MFILKLYLQKHMYRGRDCSAGTVTERGQAISRNTYSYPFPAKVPLPLVQLLCSDNTQGIALIVLTFPCKITCTVICSDNLRTEVTILPETLPFPVPAKVTVSLVQSLCSNSEKERLSFNQRYLHFPSQNTCTHTKKNLYDKATSAILSNRSIGE